MSSGDARIALFLKGRDFGGVQRAYAILARAFLARGLEVDLVHAGELSPMLADLPDGVRRVPVAPDPRLRVVRALARLPGRPLVWRALAGKPRIVACLPGLVDYLRARRPRGLLASLPLNNLVALWATRLAGVETRCVVREAEALSAKLPTQRGARRQLPPLIRRFYPEAHTVVSVSRAVADDLASTTGLRRSAITTIYNPFELERIAALAAEPPPHAWLADGEPPVVLGAGRLHPQKDFPTLLRAFARLREQRLARLVILGEGEERAPLEALARSLGIAADVRLPGYAANPFAWLARARVFALSSAWEGLANVVVEALACGTPVVSTRCSGSEEILEGGAHGRLVDVGDAEALAAAIAAELDSSRDRRALLRRAGDFSLERAIDGYLEALVGAAEASASTACTLPPSTR